MKEKWLDIIESWGNWIAKGIVVGIIVLALRYEGSEFTSISDIFSIQIKWTIGG